MRIGELSERTGVSTRLLRYYEAQGLITAERLPNGYRVYREETVSDVAKVRALLASGLPTRTIREVLPCTRGEAPEVLATCPEQEELLRRELDAIGERMASLRETHEALSAFLEATRTRGRAPG